jgi:hypothetical protein
MGFMSCLWCSDEFASHLCPRKGALHVLLSTEPHRCCNVGTMKILGSLSAIGFSNTTTTSGISDKNLNCTSFGGNNSIMPNIIINEKQFEPSKENIP